MIKNVHKKGKYKRVPKNSSLNKYLDCVNISFRGVHGCNFCEIKYKPDTKFFKLPEKIYGRESKTL